MAKCKCNKILTYQANCVITLSKPFWHHAIYIVVSKLISNMLFDGSMPANGVMLRWTIELTFTVIKMPTNIWRKYHRKEIRYHTSTPAMGNPTFCQRTCTSHWWPFVVVVVPKQTVTFWSVCKRLWATLIMSLRLMNWWIRTKNKRQPL